MLENLITYLNTLIDAEAIFQDIYGLCEIIKKGDARSFPAAYNDTTKEFKEVTVWDKVDGVCYWRLNGEISSSSVDLVGATNTNLEHSYPLKLVCGIQRSRVSQEDNAYAHDALAWAIQKAFKDKEIATKRELGVKRVVFEFGSIVHSLPEVQNEEFPGMEKEISSDLILISLELTVNITIPKSCIGDWCDDILAPSGLTATSGAASITLAWTDNSSNESSFEIQRSSTSPLGPWQTVGSVAAGVTSYEDTSVASGSFYFYRVRAKGTSKGSPWSNITGAELSSCVDGSVTLNGGDTIASDVPSGGSRDLVTQDDFGDSLSGSSTTDGSGTIIIATPNKKSEIDARVDAYFTRISAANTSLENQFRSKIIEIGASADLFYAFDKCPYWPAWNESEAQGIVPFYDLRGNLVSEDRMQKFNAPSFTANGFEGNGVDACWYVPIELSLVSRTGLNNCPAVFLNLSKVSTVGHAMGAFRTTGATFLRSNGSGATAIIYMGNSFTRYDNTAVGRWLFEFNGADNPPLAAEVDAGTTSRSYYNVGAFDVAFNEQDTIYTSSFPSGAYLLNLNGYTSQAFPANPPTSFSDHAIGGIAWWIGFEHAVNKDISVILDEIETIFGRT